MSLYSIEAKLFLFKSVKISENIWKTLENNIFGILLVNDDEFTNNTNNKKCDCFPENPFSCAILQFSCAVSSLILFYVIFVKDDCELPKQVVKSKKN